MIRANEAGLQVLKKVVDEALMKKSYHDNHFRDSLALPARFTSGDIDNFRLEVILIEPGIDPADPANREQVEP
jgi:hypothetical protein